MFHRISKHGEASFINRFRGGWITDETLFGVFDIASQRNQYFKDVRANCLCAT